MPRLDLTSLRYFLSLIAIAVGVSLLAYVLLRGGSSKGDKAAIAATPQVQTDAPPTRVPTAVAALPPTAPLVKGKAEDCFPGWRFIDNSQQRWTACLPSNLLFFDGKAVLPFEAATQDDSGRIMRDFAAVNEQWYLAQDLLARSAVDVLGPLSLKIEVAPPTLALDGCDPRQQQPGDGGVVSCSDSVFLQADGKQAISPDGAYHRYRAMVPTRPDTAARDVFSLYLTIYSYSVNWPQQEQLFRFILDRLRPY